MKKHCTYCGMLKGTSWAKVTSNSEKLKPVALAVIKLCLSEGISQLLSQSLENSIKYIYILKFHSNLLKALQADLKAFLGLVLPN